MVLGLIQSIILINGSDKYYDRIKNSREIKKEKEKKLNPDYDELYKIQIGDWGLGIGDWGLGPIPIPTPKEYD